MTDAESSPPSAQKLPLPIILLLCMGLAGFAVVVLMEAKSTDLNAQEETLTAGSAETLATLGRFEEAEAVYTDLLERSRSKAQFATYYLNRANLRYRQEKYEEAIEDYLSSMELDEIGSLYQAQWNLAQAYSRSGRTEEAEAAFEAFISEYGEELPVFTQRATHAIALLNK